MEKKLISIVIPCYKSANTVGTVVHDVKEEFRKHPEYDYQIILVNDYPADDTFQVIRRLAAEDRKIIGIDLARNFGQNRARLAAIPFIEGDIAVCMDDDGQHPVHQIFELAAKVEEGYDLVYVKFSNPKKTLFRRLTSKLNTKLLELTGAKKKGISNSSFLAWSRFSIDLLKNYKSPFPSAGAYLMKSTERVANIDGVHLDRLAGSSGYNLKRLVALWLTEITNFSLVPLRLAAMVGFGFMAVGFLMGLIALIVNIISPPILVGHTVLAGLIIFCTGVILFFIGVLGEFVGKLYLSDSGLPQSTIRTIVRNDNSRQW